MRKFVIIAVALMTIIAARVNALAQTVSAEDEARVEKAFDTANKLQEQKKYGEALKHYREALAIVPKDPSILFNAGMAAFATKDYAFAAELWLNLKSVDPLDWHARAKLIQAYQALGKFAERDAERAELFAMWKKGEPAELKEKAEYCREQFEVNGKKVMAFEHYELTGDRALRYVFSILTDKGDKEEFRISLGSYSVTNSVWRATTKPTPKEGKRLFHLDGYFKSGSHSTLGMFPKEPTYDEVRAMVVKILETNKVL